jgi:hypothetical protein
MNWQTWMVVFAAVIAGGCDGEEPDESGPPAEPCEVSGELRCTDNSLEVCSVDLAWEFAETCEGESVCSLKQEGCAKNDCATGDVVCQGLEVHKCLPGGGLIFMEKCGGIETCSVADDGCACVPDCEDRDCGTDGCGGSCGECSEELLCHGDGLCKDECVPQGTGSFVGKHMGDITWNEALGGTVTLHDFCHTAATVLIEVAEW